MKRKRTIIDFRDEIDEYGAIVKKPRQTKKSQTFDDLCNFFDGIYVGTRFMGFVIPDDPVKITKKIRDITGNKDMDIDTFLTHSWVDNVKVTEHRVLRLVLFLDKYNEHFALTQKYEKTYGASIDNINCFLDTKYYEKDLFKNIVMGNVYNVITPLFLNGNIHEPWEWGPEVLTSVMDYFRFSDRQYVEIGNKERCLELLNGPLYDMGLVKKCKHHPPIPVNIPKRDDVFVFKSKRHAYIPTMSFHDINKYDNDMVDLNATNVTSHVIEDYMTLDKKSTLIVTIGACVMMDTNGYSVTSIYNFKKLPCTAKSVVLVFKNNGEKKMYDLLDHVLCPGLKRTSALFKYIIPSNKKDSVVCYTHVNRFRSSI